MKDLFNVLKNVFSRREYLISAIAISLIFYSLNVVISNFSFIIYFYKENGLIRAIKFFSSLFLGFRETILFSSFLSLIAISILLSMLFSLIAYKTIMIKRSSKSIGFFGTTGIFLGILAPGCAACGIGLLSVFGISAAVLTFLPFKGLEISILAILILGFSVFKISKDIKKAIICKI